MKQRYRARALDGLLAMLESSDFDEREHGFFLIAQLLARANRLQHADNFGQELPRQLSRLRLSDQDQQRIADALTTLCIASPGCHPTAIWTLSHARGAMLMACLARIIEVNGASLSDESALQFCQALNRCLAEASLELANAERETWRRRLRTWGRHPDRRLRRAALLALDQVAPAENG